MYQSMRYTPGMGKGTAGPYIEIICFPSTPTWGRMRRMHPGQELRTTTLQLQCHLWIVSLLMHYHLGWSHQVQQVTHPRVLWINLLHLDMAHEKPRTNSHGGTRVLVCWQIPVHPASGMHWLVCVSVSMLYPACTPLSGEVQCKYTLLIPPHICKALLISALRGIPSMFMVEFWVVGEWTKDYLAQAQLPHPKNPKSVPP